MMFPRSRDCAAPIMTLRALGYIASIVVPWALIVFAVRMVLP